MKKTRAPRPVWNTTMQYEAIVGEILKGDKDNG